MRFVVNAIQIAGWVIAGIIALGIVLVVLDANEDNGLVDAILDVGRFFAKPFRDIFEMDDNDLEIAVNWGIAAVVYVVLGIVLSAVLQAVLQRTRRSRAT